MIRRLLHITLALILISSLTSCILDPKKSGGDTPGTSKPPDWKDLTENWHVLHNLELAYINRDIVRYRELVDIDEYVFSFAPDEPEGNWPRETDDQATSNMFSGKESNDPRYGKIVGINLELQFESATWTQVIEPGHESELWMEAVVNYIYDFSVEPNFNFINGTDAKAVFTVRQVFDAADNRLEWRLVRWRDMGFTQ